MAGSHDMLCKADTAEHLIMKIGTVRDEMEEEYDDSFAQRLAIYITNEVNAALKLLTFESITD